MVKLALLVSIQHEVEIVEKVKVTYPVPSDYTQDSDSAVNHSFHLWSIYSSNDFLFSDVGSLSRYYRHSGLEGQCQN